MARRFVEVVFDDAVAGNGSVYTADHFDLLLGSASRLALHAVVDGVSGSSPELNVSAEQTLDGRSWRAVNGTGVPEIRSVSLDPVRTNDITGAVEYPAPRFPRVRLRIFLNGTAPSARVKIYATGRDRA